jgi:uncharacterized protein YqgV (UPF0045/DUF77 family)
VQRVEFTIEPFVEGQPGAHVTEAIAAVRAMGIEVELGPFGTGCSVDDDQSAAVVAAVVRTAFANGATHANIDVATEGQTGGQA